MKQVEFARVLKQMTEAGVPFAVATVVRTEGSTLGREERMTSKMRL